jgi:hypothetical protein
MSTVQEIMQAIVKLTPDERAELDHLLYHQEDDDWDRQMIADAKAGKLDFMVSRSPGSHQKGRASRLPVT